MDGVDQSIFFDLVSKERIDVKSSMFRVQSRGKLDSTACGAVTVFTFTKTQDANEHSVAWTYDANGTYQAYWDGVQEASGSSPCSDVSNPAASDDIFFIAGATNFSGAEIFDIDRVMFSDDIMTSSQVADIDGNCSAF